MQCSCNKKAFSLDLKRLSVVVDLQFPGNLFQMSGASELNAASPCLVLTPGTESRPQAADQNYILPVNRSLLHRLTAISCSQIFGGHEANVKV